MKPTASLQTADGSVITPEQIASDVAPSSLVGVIEVIQSTYPQRNRASLHSRVPLSGASPVTMPRAAAKQPDTVVGGSSVSKAAASAKQDAAGPASAAGKAAPQKLFNAKLPEAPQHFGLAPEKRLRAGSLAALISAICIALPMEK